MAKYKKYQNKNFITTANLRLRKGAGFDKDVILVIPKGDKVKYRNFSIKEWYYVKYKDTFGYCLKDFLEEETH